MTHLQRSLIALSILVTCSYPVCGEETEEETKKTIEAPSPDGQFAFRYTGESDSEKQTYDLIDKRSGKVLIHGGGDGSITATRTVVLTFDRSDKAKIRKSTMKVAVEKQGDE